MALIATPIAFDAGRAIVGDEHAGAAMRSMGYPIILAGLALLAPIPAWALESVGSGFFVNSKGWVVTNAHVIEGCSAVEVNGFGAAQTLYIDETNDLAAVKLSIGSEHFLSFRLKPPRLGEDVAAMGYPLSSLLSDSVKITKGNINSLVGAANDTRFIQISTPIQPGNSGGPLLDESGHVIGVTTSTLGLAVGLATGTMPQNVNFAIRGIVVETFLQSYGVDYDRTEDGPLLSTADLAEKSSPAVVPILCEQEGGTEEQVAASDTRRTEEPSTTDTGSPTERAVDLVNRIQLDWSLPNTDERMGVEEYYAEPLVYFGKLVDREEARRDKRAFAERWPIRDYSIRSDNLEVDCTGSECSASGLMDYFVHSPSRGESTDGVASFDLVVDIQREIVLEESSKVISGLDADPSTMLLRWNIFDGACRGGSGDEDATWIFCDWREDVSTSLEAAGWCYGREGEYGYESQWRRCDERSIAGDTLGLTGYPAQVVAQVRSALRYPTDARATGVTGEVVVRFTLMRDGSVSSIDVTESSGWAVLDQAAVATIRNAAPFPAFPADERRFVWPFTVPLAFTR